MGKKNNVNPDHYKTAGREKPGQDIVQEIHKQKLAQGQENENGSKFISGSTPGLSGSSAKETKNDVGQINESGNSSSNT